MLISWAPGAIPSKRPFSPRLPTAAPTTRLAWLATPRFSATSRRSASIWTPKPTDSLTGVSGSSVPNTPKTGRSEKSPSAVSSVKSRSWSVSTQTSPASSSQSTAKSRLEPSGLPSRFTSFSTAAPCDWSSPDSSK